MSKMLRDEDGRYTSSATRRVRVWNEQFQARCRLADERDARHRLQNRRLSECEWHRKFWPRENLRATLKMAVMSGAITRR